MAPSLRSRYHWPGVPRSSKAFSTYAGCLPTLAGPTRLAVRFPLGSITRLVELSQQGWAMVMFVSSMPATGQRGSVHGPRPKEPSDHNALPPVYTNSMSPGFRHLAITAELAV